MIKRKKRDEGFTFVETIIVLGIILILTSTVGFVAFRFLDQARQTAARNQIEAYSVALQSYYMDNGRFPTQEQGLHALWETPSLDPVPRRWNGPYISRSVAEDPWGNNYEYIIPGPHGLPFGIRSFGADGREGGEGTNRDISSWEN